MRGVHAQEVRRNAGVGASVVPVCVGVLPLRPHPQAGTTVVPNHGRETTMVHIE